MGETTKLFYIMHIQDFSICTIIIPSPLFKFEELWNPVSHIARSNLDVMLKQYLQALQDHDMLQHTTVTVPNKCRKTPLLSVAGAKSLLQSLTNPCLMKPK